MANSDKPPQVHNIIPLTEALKAEKPKTQTQIPEELKQLDGAALGSIQPERNEIDAEGSKVVRLNEPANHNELNLHPDGTLLKFIAWEEKPPACRIVDGAGRVIAIGKNAEFSDLICNGVNAMHLAQVLQMAEDQKKRIEESAKDNPSGEPPAILLPPTK